MNSKLLVTLILVATLSCGCIATYYPQNGMVATRESMVELNNSAQKGEIKDIDTSISYDFVRQGDRYKISGLTTFQPSLLNSFPQIEQFSLYLVFLDENGVVLSSTPISPFYQFLQIIDGPLKFSYEGTFPDGATAITFSYAGSFLGGTNQSKDSWKIASFPFSKRNP